MVKYRRINGVKVKVVYGVYRPMKGYSHAWIRTGKMHGSKQKANKAKTRVARKYGRSKILRHLLPTGV